MKTTSRRIAVALPTPGDARGSLVHPPLELLRRSRSPAMKSVLQRIEQLAGRNIPVLLTGESGTGKEVVARALHEASGHANQPFVAINCAAIPPDLIESELFGHARGAFTGASVRRVGKFASAGEGVLLLDEIGDLPGPLQTKLLRVVQERQFEPVGSNRMVEFRARLICATSRSLEDEVADGRFRLDLYYRIAVVTLRLPSLSERPEDMSLLAKTLLHRLCTRDGSPVVGISADAVSALQAQEWPGNIRQLENVLFGAMLSSCGSTIGPEHLALGAPRRATRGAGGPGGSFLPTSPDEIRPLEDYELDIAEAAMEACDGNLSEAARRLQISRPRLRRKLLRSGG